MTVRLIAYATLVAVLPQTTPERLKGPPPCSDTQIPTQSSPCVPPPVNEGPTPSALPDARTTARGRAERQFFEDRSRVKSFGRALIDGYAGGRTPSTDEKKALRKQAQTVESSLPRIVAYIGAVTLSPSTPNSSAPVDVLNELLPVLRHLNDGLDAIATNATRDVAKTQQLLDDIPQLKQLLKRFR